MPPRILLVDDADEVRTSLARMLARRYEVHVARAAEEAIELFAREGPFPVVVSDQQLPGLDGLSLLAELHRHAPETAAILLSGLDDPLLPTRAVASGGVYRFLRKPCGLDELSAAIDAALERHQELEHRQRSAARLSFSRDSLEQMNGLLEQRVALQSRSLRGAQAYAEALSAADSVAAIVRLAARTASEALGGRGVCVQAWDAECGGPSTEAAAGPEISARMHFEPLEAGGAKLGEIVVDLGGASRLPERERELLAAVAGPAAAAARREFHHRRREDAQQALVLALARLTAQRGGGAGRHGERLALCCRLLAEGLRAGSQAAAIDAEWIRDLEHACVLHDVGKAFVPDAILLKPAALTPQEWPVVRAHAELGAQALQAAQPASGQHALLSLARDIAWCHHERWDGGGYPRGLAGEAIPLAARIVALADVYDALTSRRPQRPAWSHAAAAAWIAAQSDTHFDPAVAAAFAAQQTAIDDVRRRLADEPGAQASASGIGDQRV